MNNRSLLVDGRIPARTECPFAAQCTFNQNNECRHNGADHAVPFSCATARGFDLIQRTSPQERTFILHWRAGKPAEQTVKGTGKDQLTALANACTNAGIGRGAIAALDYWEEKT